MNTGAAMMVIGIILAIRPNATALQFWVGVALLACFGLAAFV